MSEKRPPPHTVADDAPPPPYSEAAPTYTSAGDIEDEILVALIDAIDSFKASVASYRTRPKTVEAVLIPEDALPFEWVLTDEGDKHKGEMIKSIRVKCQTKGKEKKGSRSTQSDASSSGRKEFDGWGRYDDERPSTPNSEVSLWWRDEDLAQHLAQSLQSAQTTQPIPSFATSLHIRPEEVTFRRENEMGLWESKTGWGIVLRMQLTQ